MKALGILFTISAIVNLLSVIAADDNDAAQESWISFATLILFAGFFYYRGFGFGTDVFAVGKNFGHG